MDSSVLPDPDTPLSSSASAAALRDNQHQQQRPSSSQRRSSVLALNRSPRTPPSPRPRESPFNRQNRRLQLRNAGFRGGVLLPTFRPVSPQLATWRSFSGGSERHGSQEDSSVVDFGSRRRWSDDVQSSASQKRRNSILQEIGNSTQRRASHSPRPLLSTLFDELEKENLIVSESVPRAPFDNPRPKTPLLEPFSPDEAMKPSPRPSSNTPNIPSLRYDGRQKRQTASSRVVSRGTTRYIEHLEAQLAASLSRTDSDDPSALNSYASKYKTLSSEHRLLKEELAEWEERFEARIKEEIGVMVDRESQLRSKVRVLERELETKDNKIRELEWEAEMDHQRLRSLEAVNSTNRSLERRVDVLTELLAQSPSKSEQDARTNIGLGSIPPDDEPVRRTPRPRSMFSRIPLSPVRRQLFQPLVVPESESNDADGGVVRHDEVPELDVSYTEAVAEERPVSELGSLDSGLGDSCSVVSTRPYGSQRSSTISHSSGSSMCGTSFPLPLDLPRRHRRMRRFPSGSCTLKPLILPATSSLLSPTSPSCHYDSVEHSATHLRTYSANEWHSPSNFVQVHEDTLDALEGNTHQYQSFEEAISGHALSDVSDVPYEDDVFGDGPDADCFPNGHLHPPGLFDTPIRHPHSDLDPSKKPFAHDAHSPAGMTVHGGSSRKKRRLRNREYSPGPEVTPLIARHFSARKPSADLDLAINSTIGHSHWFRDIISGSIVLAKRILFNSWHSNWKKIGRLPWWVLGLILGVQRRDGWFKRSVLAHAAWTPVDSSSAETNPLGRVDHTRAGTNATTQSPARTRLSVQESKKRSNTDSSNPNCDEVADTSVTRLAPPFHLWAKFSLAIALAIGLAIRDGPASLMCPCAAEQDSEINTRSPSGEPFKDAPLIQEVIAKQTNFRSHNTDTCD
uniref:Uncharacterized protein n=1 Tax=Coccidioides posadasii RMSCC 3488 TaxID=454284 RepID=A0A0J6FIF2_COCPO|nr:hypothetical protein CPAG_06405 [Coccidioides posadasii RMSCC 3488]